MLIKIANIFLINNTNFRNLTEIILRGIKAVLFTEQWQLSKNNLTMHITIKLNINLIIIINIIDYTESYLRSS